MKKRLVLSCMLLVMLIGMTSMRANAKASDTPKKDFANIVLFAHFSGENAQEDAAYFAKKENRDKIISYYNGDYGRSMKNYLATVSYGKFQIHNIFPQDDGTKITSYGLSMSEEDAQNRNIDSSIIEEIIRNIPEIQGQTIDYDGDGIIDNLTVVMKGAPPAGSSSVVPTLVSHKSDFPDPSVKWSGKGIGTYNMLSTDRILDQQSGVIIHEFLHSLGYPDLYRGNIKDPGETCDHPVFIWDIMASASYRVSYPLAYLRMKYTNWLDIETVTESTSLTLDTQDKADGNQAYILKSPLNEHELFIVEYRKAGARFTESNQYNMDSLDSALTDDSKSGVIVYRVNTTVTGLSNYYGQTGIYVFRPQEGQSGYETNTNGSYNENATVLNAALSGINGRTSIGQEDLNKKLTDGALTFSNGSNSGIVISNVKRQGDSQMTLDVSIPDAADFDLWKDTEFADSGSNDSNKNTAMTSCGGIQYLITYNPVTFSSGKLQLYIYKENSWAAMGSTISVTGVLTDKKLFSYKNELYLAYITTDQKIYIKKSSTNGSWMDILTISDAGSDFDIKETTKGLYLTYAPESSRAILVKIENNSFTQVGEYFSKQYSCGQPKVCELNGTIYTSVRDASENNTIKIFKYNGGSGFSRVDNGSITGDTYDIASLDGKIYIPLGGSDLKMMSYDGSNWTTGKSSGISSFEPVLSATQGNLYVLVSATSGNGNIKIYQYDTETGNYIQEGTDVDTAGQNLSLTSSENKLFVNYVRKLDGKIIVKAKNTANELLSLTIVPPEKTTYFQGDKIDSSGIKVTANYTKGSRELAAGTYQITDFDTSTVGDRIATVTYGGKKGIFPYMIVMSNHEHQFTEWKAVNTVCKGGNYKERSCSICGYKETSGSDAHDWEQKYTVDKNATCTQNGSKSIHCKNCEAVKDNVIINASGHSYQNKTTKATVSKNGSIVTACSVCGAEKSSTTIYFPKTITLSKTSYTYNGKEQKPSVVVKDSKGKVVTSSNYMVYYPAGCKAAGQYTVSIAFKGNYSGTVKKSYKIIPKGTTLSKLSGGKKKLTVKWKKQTKEISGYQIQYSTSKNFKSSKKTKNVSKKKTSVNISKLKSKKSYYVRIRTYKTVKVNGKSQKIYSGWSKKKAVKVK